MGSGRHIEIIARGLLIRRNRVLLCRAKRGGYHYLPGGHVEFGESFALALAREFDEETGRTIAVGPPLLVHEQAFETSNATHHEVNTVFHVEHVQAPDDDAGFPVIESREEDIAFDWVDLAALPETDLRPVELKAWLAAGGAVSPSVGWLASGVKQSPEA